MNTENTLIDRYIHEVGQHLPKKTRDDIMLELRSALQDMLEERKLDALAASDEEAISQMLIEFGRPEKVASSYLPTRSVIGPHLFSPFLMALKIAGSVLIALSALGIGLDIVNERLTAASFFLSMARLSSNLFQMLGVIVVVFLILDRSGAGSEETDKEWNPIKLPKIDDPTRINRTETIVTIVFSIAALIVFNFFPEIVAVYASVNGQWSTLALLTPEFLAFVPLLSVVWALEVALRIELLRRGRWNSGLRFAEFLLSIFGLFVLYLIITGGPIITLSALSWLVKGALTIALAVSLIETIGQAYRLLVPPVPSSKAMMKTD